jgi:hypothetical protein
MAIITTQSTTQSQVRVCDFCTRKGNRAKTCYGCLKDVCSSCATIPEYDPFTGEYAGDYPPYLCAPCAEKLKPFEARAAAVREIRDDELEALEQKFRAACRESTD